MKKQVKYTGYSTTPSDYESPDGDLTTALNLVPEDGQLKPLPQPEDLAHLPSGYRIVFIHKTANYTHYIVQYLIEDHNYLYWFDQRDMTALYPPPVTITTGTLHLIHDFAKYEDPLDPDSERMDAALHIYKINALGNTLCVMAEDGLHYCICKSDSSTYYKYLGKKPPFVDLSFGLSDNKMEEEFVYNSDVTRLPVDEGNYTKQNYVQSRTSDTDEDFEYFLAMETGHKSFHVQPARAERLNEIIWGLVNKTTNIVSNKGHFYAPFFVRYCYRMYDGTMVMHSAPVFMPVSMPQTHQVALAMTIDPDDGTINWSTAQSRLFSAIYFPNNVALTCSRLSADIQIQSLKNDWGDIIKSLDIFVSLPITREDTEDHIKHISICDVPEVNPNPIPYCLRGNGLTQIDYIARTNTQGALDPDNNAYKVLIEFPMVSEEKYLERIQDVSNFYKIKSIDIDRLLTEIPTSTYTEIELDKSILPSLSTQEVMTDDYKTHNIPTYLISDSRCITSLYPYNGRLNMSGLREQLFGGFRFRTMVPQCINQGVAYVLSVYVYLDTEDGVRIVKWESSSPYERYVSRAIIFNCPLFYPDNRAVRMKIYVDESFHPIGETTTPSYKLYDFKMKPHNFLNGAITDGGPFTSPLYPSERESGEDPNTTISDIVDISNKLYTSEVGNPFFFPATGINSVGSGSILGISSATKALSQGQFGQFPLYAFTTDGVWALEVSSTGTFSAKQPISRDVCSSLDSITQIDNAVLFATDRGIMHISGSMVTCISEVIESESPFDVKEKLPHANDLHAMLGHQTDTCLPTQPFFSFLSGCRMLYDYTHQRIIVYNTHYTYAYVFSLKSKMWGMMYTNLEETLNSYPDAMAIDRSNHLVNFSYTPTITTEIKSMLVTRPLKLGDGDTLKSIHTVLQRGMFERGDVVTVLYGSRDMYNWHLVASSTNHEIRNLRGTPYKYFRIATVSTLTPDKSLFGATIDAEPRHLSQIH